MSGERRKPLVYVAGPISGNPWGCVRQAMEAFGMLRRLGCVPFLPQFSVLGEMVKETSYEDWMAYDFDVIRRCDALVRIYGESPGADREVELAKSLGIPVWSFESFAHMSDLFAWAETWRASRGVASPEGEGEQ